MDDAAWDRALKQAMRSPYVVQEKVSPVRSVFPMVTYGHLEFKEMQVAVGPLRVPHGDLRPPGVQRDAGGRAPARLSGQGAELLELALHRQWRLLVGGRVGAHFHFG